MYLENKSQNQENGKNSLMLRFLDFGDLLPITPNNDMTFCVHKWICKMTYRPFWESMVIMQVETIFSLFALSRCYNLRLSCLQDTKYGLIFIFLF